MEIVQWIEDNLLKADWQDNSIFKIEDNSFLVLSDKEKILDENFSLVLTDKEKEKAKGVDYLAFLFGDSWYYTSSQTEPTLTPLKYIGKANIEFNDVDFPYLGIHGQHELMNGTRKYEDWCKKAVFLNQSALGICERQTLAGTFKFQKACQDHDIKPILGQTTLVKNDKEETYELKLYAKNELGWNNLLHINKAQLVDNVESGKFISENELFSKGKGIVCVVPTEIKLSYNYIQDIKNAFDDVFYQIDPVEWKSNEKDKKHLLQIKDYLDHHRNHISPIIITDSYYLDRSDAEIKKKLNKIGKVQFQNQSQDQYFKSLDEIIRQLANLFNEEGGRLEWLFNTASNNLQLLVDKCTFEIKTGELHLPVYEMNEEEKGEFSTNEDLFWHLVEEGFKEKISGKVEDEQVYIDRIETEAEIIVGGNLVSYFLIWYDALRYANENGISYGLGRGSGSASLISYLFSITNVDPIKWDLFFERFLNWARIKSGMPDLDIDIMSEHQETIKKYFVNKYGVEQTCYVGTYGVLKIKSLIKDLAKDSDVSFGTVNYVTGALPQKQQDELKNMTEVFEYAQETPVVKNFIQENYKIFNLLNLGLNSIRNKSIHASALIIAPKKDNDGNKMTIYDWFPVRMQDGVLVSEFEGEELDELGFLKQDVLGLKQVDKIANTLNLINKDYNENLLRDNITLDNDLTFEYFQKGLTQDIFQFSSSGMAGFLKDLYPTHIEHLIAANALYRPGAMASDFHRKYVNIKNGREEPKFMWGTEEILKNTYGLLIYQENTLKLIKDLAKFSLEDSEAIRKSIGKKKEDLMQKYKSQFVEGIKQSGGSEKVAEEIWKTIEATSGYQFNRGHSTCYTIVGYYTQYLKVHYPLQFWTTALQYDADGKNFPSFLSEIEIVGEVSVKAPDINKSKYNYTYDLDTKEIFMSLSAIKHVGEIAVNKIIEERNQNGNYFSLEEFYNRIDKGKVNKRVIECLIISGSFDQVEGVQKPQNRYELLQEYYKLANIKSKEQKELDWDEIDKEHYWILLQRELTGLGQLNLEKIYNQSGIKQTYLPINEFFENKNVDKDCGISGVLTNLVERNTKNGTMAQLELDCNMHKVYCTIWNDVYEGYGYKKLLKEAQNKIICLSGTVRYDSWKKQNVLMSNPNSKIVKL